MVVRVGIIGFRNHAYRLYTLIQNHPDAQISKIYHPTKTFNLNECTNDFSDLYDSDVIIIASPNFTHFEYIKKLISNFSGYIFCEKPPVTSNSELIFLKNLPTIHKQKIFFNFNYRFSKLSTILKENLNSEKLGKISHINVISTKGIAFNDDYPNSWRADGTNNLHNILDTVSIHYLDLLFYNLGKITSINYSPELISQCGTSFDTCHISLTFENGITASIYNSYASPYVNEITFVGTNGIITIRNNQFTLSSPRDTFDKNNLFSTPPISEKFSLLLEDDYHQSLEKSINYFISIVKKQSTFAQKFFDTSITSNQTILNLHNMDNG